MSSLLSHNLILLVLLILFGASYEKWVTKFTESGEYTYWHEGWEPKLKWNCNSDRSECSGSGPVSMYNDGASYACYDNGCVKRYADSEKSMEDGTNYQMGQPLDECDDGKTNLENDWDESATNYTCTHAWTRYQTTRDVKIVETCDNIPVGYAPSHYCMRDKIEYDTAHPTHGHHRWLWAVYGEYNFVPPQRWLHNVEHGAVVMLYHPCANQFLVSKLRSIVTQCIRKHIIAADIKVSLETPLVLIAWGCKLSMNTVDYNKVTSFIKRHAMKGPEGTLATDGKYSIELLKKAEVPYGSDYQDSTICPQTLSAKVGYSGVRTYVRNGPRIPMVRTNGYWKIATSY